jgi:O-antigen ligase
MALAATVLLLPKNLRHFADLLAAVTLVVLALCYLGVILAPALAVHQFSDFLEPEHAGSWRGLFPHKNQAGATMVILVFIGLFLARARSPAIGGAIVILSTIFLLFSYSKTAIAMLPCVLLISGIIIVVRNRLLQGIVAIGTLALINLFSVGAAFFEPVQAALALVIPDPTFTGRTDIWQFALAQLLQRPITGYGFAAFWGTENVVYGLSSGFTWATAATDAHNAYLNIALTTGIPGLILTIAWIVFLPLFDFQRSPHDAESRPLAILFLRIWLFGIYAASFESTIFQQVGEVWFILLVAVFGLRLLSSSRVRA